MQFSPVRYFGMAMLAVYSEGVWCYVDTSTSKLLPFVFQDHVEYCGAAAHVVRRAPNAEMA
jgi:hypothetical protein